MEEFENAEAVGPDEDQPTPKGEVAPDTSPKTTKNAASTANRGSDIALSEAGLLQPTTHTEAWRVAQTFLQSGAVPAQFKNVAQVFMAIQYLREIGFKTVAGLRQCTIINGNLSIWGDLPLAAVRQGGELAWIEEKIYTREYNEICFANKNIDDVPYYAVCRLQRKGSPITVERVFSMGDATVAGLLGSPTWKKYPKRMLQARARSWALKDEFPERLCGIAIAEYDHNMLFDAATGSSALPTPPTQNLADKINAEYLGDENEQPG